jgi:hypothetical protein
VTFQRHERVNGCSTTDLGISRLASDIQCKELFPRVGVVDVFYGGVIQACDGDQRAKNQPRLTSESASMMARDIQTIQPLEPLVQSDTGPGAQPLCLARGESTPQPTIAPSSICRVVAGPMMMP